MTVRCARCPAPAYTRTPHLAGRAAALCRPCADAFERDRRLERLCDECAELPATVCQAGVPMCATCAAAVPRFRAASHAWLTRRVEAPAPVVDWERW